MRRDHTRCCVIVWSYADEQIVAGIVTYRPMVIDTRYWVPGPGVQQSSLSLHVLLCRDYHSYLRCRVELELECVKCQTLTNTSCCLPRVLCPTFRVCVVVREPIIAPAPYKNPHLAEEEEEQRTLSGSESPAETVTAL